MGPPRPERPFRGPGRDRKDWSRVEIGGDSTAADVNTELAPDGGRVIAQGATLGHESVLRECSGSAKRG